MRILQICPRIPWPPMDGGRVAMAQLTESLRRNGAHVDVAALNQRKFHADVPRDVHAVDIDTSDYLGALLRVRKLRAPLLVARFYSPRFESLLRELLRKTPYDVIHLEGQFLLPYVPAIREETRAPIALRAQNVEFRIWEHLGKRWMAHSLRHWEIAHVNDCDALIPISQHDADDFRNLGATKPMRVVPCGTPASPPAEQALLQERSPPSLYFLGSMLYRPNTEAVAWLATKAWPLIRAAVPAATLTIAGSSFPRGLREQLEAQNIRVASDIPSVEAFAKNHRAMLAPLFSGSGMRIKVLEAMAMGKPVIATPLGAGGIDVIDGENILLGATAEEFAQHAIRIVRDDALAHRIGSSARELVAKHYDPDAIAQTLLQFYKRLSAS